MDLYEWMATRLKIIDKAARFIPFLPNEHQLRVYAYLAAQRAAGLPARLIVLKARQPGISTAVEALGFALAYHTPNLAGLVCAHDDESSTALFRMTRRFEESLPPRERKATDYSSRKEIVFSAPHRSIFQVQTAGKVQLVSGATLGRGKTIHFLHCSELPYWRDARTTLLSVLQAVPEEAGTTIIFEFTASGASGEAYERWCKALARVRADPHDLGGYYPMFVSWLDIAEYRTRLDVGETVGPEDDEERALADLGAGPEQLKWRRRVLADKCNGDVVLFQQEYPASPEEAFARSGRPAIPQVIVARHGARSRPPLRRVRLKWGLDGKVIAEDVDATARFAWWVWREPTAECDYTVAGDVMEGQLADPSDPRSAADWSTGIVLNRRRLSIDAVWRGQIEPDYVGEQLHLASTWYNTAWVSPEVNAAGMAALVPLRKATYTRLFVRKKPPDNRISDELVQYGHKTTSANRDWLIDQWIAACRPGPGGDWEGRIDVQDQRIADEERTFVRTAHGKREHQVGYHDDLLFGCFIALELHQQCPRTLETKPVPRTSRRLRSSAFGGGLDDEDLEEGGGDETT